MDILDEKPSCSAVCSKQYQTLNVIISTGQSKENLGRSINAKDLDAGQDEIEAYYKIYELNYANKIG